MLTLYQTTILILSIILYPWLKINKKTAPFLSQRYGYKSLPAGEFYWFHGASLGEIQGLLPLIKLLRSKDPQAQILGTATSVKGYQQISEIADFASLLPIDHPIYLKKFLGKARIKKFIFGETELWPTMLRLLNKQQVPCYLLNGRLSDFNFKQYYFFRRFFKPILQGLKKIYCISDLYQQRFIDLGADSSKVKVTGNLKYDQAGAIITPSQALAYQAKTFSNHLPVLTLASIRPEEESFFTQIIKDYQQKFNIVIVPRHAEKFSYFKDYLNDQKISFQLKSKLTEPTADCIVLYDVIGELNQIYSFSTVSFIGGSLVKGVGGHNPMEGAPYQNILIIGTEYQNQLDCVTALVANQAIFVVSEAKEICDILDRYKDLHAYGSRALQVWEGFQGNSQAVFWEIFGDA